MIPVVIIAAATIPADTYLLIIALIAG